MNLLFGYCWKYIQLVIVQRDYAILSTLPLCKMPYLPPHHLPSSHTTIPNSKALLSSSSGAWEAEGCYRCVFVINFIKQNYISLINLLLIKYSPMSAKKKLSNGSLPTQTENSRRFVRRNSVHTLTCRSGSLKKLSFASEELVASSPFLETPPTHNPEKTALEIETEDLFKQLPPAYDPPLKRSAGSMKIDHPCRDAQRLETLTKELSAARQETEVLSAQVKKLKSHLGQQREKRRLLQDEARCSQQEIRRLEKRLEKYRNEKERYEEERDAIIKHIEELQAIKLGADVLNIQTYRVKIMEEEVCRVRGQLQKGRSQRERELLGEVERLIELKYALENQLKSANVANAVLTKQLEEDEQEMIEIRDSVHKTVTSSYQYIELRERYRKMLLEYRELRLEMSMMEKESGREELEGTLLTVSESEDRGYSDL